MGAQKKSYLSDIYTLLNPYMRIQNSYQILMVKSLAERKYGERYKIGKN
jgi:hypothetical protein